MRSMTLSLCLIAVLPQYSYSDSLQEFNEKSAKLNNIIQSHETNFEKQAACLAQAIYFEAAHSLNSQKAVANVILNRVVHTGYPHSVCGVINQRTTLARTKKQVCQFSYKCEPPKKIVKDSDKWADAKTVASNVLGAFVTQSREDLTKGATHFHDKRVLPHWAKSPSFLRTLKTKQLTFYKQK